MLRKRKQQYGKLVTFRKYQFGGIVCAMGFYLLFYRKFIHPKTVNNSVVYNQAITYIKQSKIVKANLGN